MDLMSEIVCIKNGKRSTSQTRDTRQSAGIKSKSNRTLTAGGSSDSDYTHNCQLSQHK